MAKKVFAISQFFAVSFWVADGKELLCRPLANGKELADDKVADSSSATCCPRRPSVASLTPPLLHSPTLGEEEGRPLLPSPSSPPPGCLCRIWLRGSISMLWGNWCRCGLPVLKVHLPTIVAMSRLGPASCHVHAARLPNTVPYMRSSMNLVRCCEVLC